MLTWGFRLWVSDCNAPGDNCVVKGAIKLNAGPSYWRIVLFRNSCWTPVRFHMNYQLLNLWWWEDTSVLRHWEKKKRKKPFLFICQITVSHHWIKWAISLIRKKSMCTLRRLFSVGSWHIQKEKVWQRHKLQQNISPTGPIFLLAITWTGFTLK